MKKSLLLCVCLSVIVFDSQASLIVRFWEKSDKCPIETPFYEQYYEQCFGCNYTGSMLFQKNLEDFKKCQNRVIEQTYKSENHNEYRSFLKECPDEYPLRDYWGGCNSCAETKAIAVKKQKRNTVCPNRSTKNWSDIMDISILKSCPSVAPLFNGKDCLPCYTEEYDFSKEECQKCNETQFKREYIDGKTTVGKFTGSESGCYLQEFRQFYEVHLSEPGIMRITMDTPRQYSYSCNEEKSIMTLPCVCERCPNRSYNTETGECVFDRKLMDDEPVFMSDCNKKEVDHGRIDMSKIETRLTINGQTAIIKPEGIQKNP